MTPGKTDLAACSAFRSLPTSCQIRSVALPSDVPIAPTILWFRQDLRLADNAALAAALARGGPIIPVFVHDEAGEGRWPAGSAARWWWHGSLTAFTESLAERGGRLIVRQGDSQATLRTLVQETGATAVYWNRRYEPAVAARDVRLAEELSAVDCEAKSFPGALLFEPEEIANKTGNPFQVFTPFWRHCQAQQIPVPTKVAVKRWPAPQRWPRSLELDALKLRPPAVSVAQAWTPGEAGALRQLRRFLTGALDGYADRRDFPAEAATSALSPHLHFGEIGPRQIWAEVRALSADSGVFPASRGAQRFLTELGWREFAYNLLHHFPHTPEEPLRAEFGRFPWADDPGGAKLRAWQRGETGYPIVDAGMRELAATGWMHNRVRMIVASFLVKHLRLSWTQGAAWFWEKLVDADLANNTLGWQWSAGCGADAAPYFRIFNPVRQGEKFDAQGVYVRRWVPELAKLPDNCLHQPWTARPSVLEAAGVKLGATYPRPIVDHATARTAALAAFQALRGRRGKGSR
jgi:deoxyribodipyrimidine photo-lyase